MFEEAISSISTWLTPTVLFILLNLMIATIAFSSSSPKPPPLHRSPSLLHRLKSLNIYSYIHSPPPPTTHFQPPPPIIDLHPPPQHPHDDVGPTLEEVYTSIIQKQSVPQYGRQSSDTKPSAGEVPIRLPAKMKKSATVKSPFNHFEAVAAPGDEVDVRAGDFINRFRNQLKIQRLESIVRYKNMITRGTEK